MPQVNIRMFVHANIKLQVYVGDNCHKSNTKAVRPAFYAHKASRIFKHRKTANAHKQSFQDDA